MSENLEQSDLRVGYKTVQLGPREIPIPDEWGVFPFHEAIELNPKYEKPDNGPFDYLPMDAVDEEMQTIEYWTQREKGDCTTTWFKNGDTVYAKITPCTENGKIAFVNGMSTELGSGSTEFFVFHPCEGVTDDHFVFYFSNLPAFRSVTISLMEGSTGRQRVPSDVFKASLNIPIPPLPEQRRIAEILSTVDELIQQTDAIIEETERLKRGLMQDLLTGGIGHESYKTVQIGPKQYTIPEKWKVTCLDNVGNVITGRTPPTDDARNYEGNIPFITPADLGRHKYVKNTNKSLTTKGLKETREVKSGAVTVVCIGSTIGKIGLAHTLSATNQQINSICPNEKHSSEYLYYAILLFTNILISRAGVAVIPIVNKADFSRLPIIIPPLVEQKYIAQILSTVDRDLATKRKSKKFLASLKRGLMQDLLTGKVRVPVGA